MPITQLRRPRAAAHPPAVIDLREAAGEEPAGYATAEATPARATAREGSTSTVTAEADPASPHDEPAGVDAAAGSSDAPAGATGGATTMGEASPGGVAAMLASLSPDALRWALADVDGAVLGEALEGLGAEVTAPAVRVAVRGWETAALTAAASDLVGVLAGRVLDGDVPDAVLTRSVDDLQRLERRVVGERLRRVREIDERSAHLAQGGRTTADLLAQMGLTRGEAREQVETALALGAMPATAAKLANGDIGLGQASVAAKAAKELAEHDAASGVEAEEARRRQERLDAAAAGSKGCDRNRLRDQLESWKAKEAPDLLARKEQRARRNRRLHKWIDDKGAGRIDARGPAAEHAHIASMIDALARPDGPDDQRTPEQRQYDALAHIAQRYLAEGKLPEVAAAQPHVILTATPEGLHGHSDAEPPVLDGFGPVSSATAQMICCDAEVTLVRLGDRGEPLFVGRAQRRPNRAQRRAVIGRDRRCVGCGAPASRCQIHHAAYWSLGGRTDITNLVLLCWNCHFHVHHHGWTVSRDTDGRYRAGPAGTHAETAVILGPRPDRQPC